MTGCIDMQDKDSRPTKKSEIDNLLQQTSNYVKEGFNMAKEINVTLFQSEAKNPELEKSTPECEKPRGWFDTVILRLESIRREAEKTNLQLSKLAQETIK